MDNLICLMDMVMESNKCNLEIFILQEIIRKRGIILIKLTLVKRAVDLKLLGIKY